jgi:hypothetical protein
MAETQYTALCHFSFYRIRISIPITAEKLIIQRGCENFETIKTFDFSENSLIVETRCSRFSEEIIYPEIIPNFLSGKSF